jgi:hypothetical protein
MSVSAEHWLTIELCSLASGDIEYCVTCGSDQTRHSIQAPNSLVAQASILSQQSLDPVRTVGQELFKNMFSEQASGVFRRALFEAARSKRAMTLAIGSSVAALKQMPWELLYDTQLGRFLALSRYTPIVRYVPKISSTTQSPSAPAKIRILVILSSPSNKATLNMLQEKKWLRYALEPLMRAQNIDVIYIENPLLEDVQARLASEEFHILHFIGHGEYDSTNQQGTLILEDEAGKAKPLSAAVLEGMLSRTNLRLVILNACQTYVHDATLGGVSISDACLRAGIPYVMATQAPITDNASIAFSKAFYRNLLSGANVIDSITAGRQSIQSESYGFTNEWATPVLSCGIVGSAMPLFNLAHTSTAPQHRFPEPDQNFDHQVDEIIRKGMYERLRTHLFRLALFEEQRAYYGPVAPAKTELEIEWRKQEITELQSRLDLYTLPAEWQEHRQRSMQKQLTIRTARLEKLRHIQAQGDIPYSEKVDLELEIDYFEHQISLLKMQLSL